MPEFVTCEGLYKPLKDKRKRHCVEDEIAAFTTSNVSEFFS